jgi:signal transduction histidine kinase
VRQRGLNVIGHELRTPVSVVRGMAEALAAGGDPSTQEELVVALLRNTRRLESLVDELLTASGITTALPVGPDERVDLAAEVRSAGGNDKDLSLDGEGVALARRSSVERIVAAVLDNARAYGEPPVSVQLADRGDKVHLSVDSPGVEVSPEDVKFAVEPFWRGERAVTLIPGLGLGLSVASALAEHEGGRLRVKARPGGGMITLIELRAG